MVRIEFNSFDGVKIPPQVERLVQMLQTIAALSPTMDTKVLQGMITQKGWTKHEDDPEAPDFHHWAIGTQEWALVATFQDGINDFCMIHAIPV